jgi:hypothetical protein
MDSPYVWSGGVQSGSSQSAKMEVPAKNKSKESRLMLRNLRFRSFAVALVSVACLGTAGNASTDTDSGQRNFRQFSVEPAINSGSGATVYILTPIKAPFPSKANPDHAVAPLYLPLYPVTSTVPAFELNCQPTNCDHVNVLPFPSVDYGALPGTDKACVDFNGGSPCSLVEGHDHLIGVAPTGDFNVAWHVELVVFTHAAFLDGKINTRILTEDQIDALVKSGDVIIIDTPVTFNCSITSERTYELGTPVVIPFP